MTEFSSESRNPVRALVILVVLAVSGIVARLAFQDLPNFSPVAAIALFAGYYSRDLRIALALPLIVMAISDLFIGSYDIVTMIVVYAFLALPAVFGSQVAKSKTGAKATPWLIASSLGGSVCFFLGTNLAVFVQSSMYESSAAGLIKCYTLALPFFKYTVSGDLIFGCVIFASYAIACSVVTGKSNEPNVIS